MTNDSISGANLVTSGAGSEDGPETPLGELAERKGESDPRCGKRAGKLLMCLELVRAVITQIVYTNPQICQEKSCGFHNGNYLDSATFRSRKRLRRPKAHEVEEVK